VDLSVLNKEPIVIYGGGGHAKTIIDLIISADEYSVVGIIDDDVSRIGEKVLGIPILGGSTYLERIYGLGIRKAVNCVGGIVDTNIRLRITKQLLEKNFILPTLVHSSAIIEPSATILNGSQILAKSYIGSEAVVGEGCMINTSAVISHDCFIGKHSHVAPGSLLAGNVSVGERTLIGMGVTTTIGIKIGSGVRIGNGAILLADVPDHTIIQAGRYWVGKKE
jgi:sugar O-acyltransferase (sialic acid O-acetyltransferase NeuD family)